MSSVYSIYLHIPFCVHRCSYCDFNTYAGQEAHREDYVRALCAEIRQVASSTGTRLPVHTIFFGGGTPSLLAAREVESILQSIEDAFDLLPGVEITLEANPGTLQPEPLKDLRRMGVNRISMGMQSAHPDDLRILERQHDYLDVAQSVRWAHRAGFDNLSLDLMFGLPEQDTQRWEQTLDLALGLNPAHLSLYALTLEHGTPFQHWMDKGFLALIDPDLAADMYELAEEKLADAGYLHYEISNWAKLANQDEPITCRHNLQYWRNLPYLGFGAGAHGFAGGTRTANVLGIRAYIERFIHPEPRSFPLSAATASATEVDRWNEIRETMMMGLRLTQEGVSARNFHQRFGMSLEQVYAGEIAECIRFGLLEWAGADGDTLRLTRRGYLLGNQVFMRFVGKEDPLLRVKPQEEE